MTGEHIPAARRRAAERLLLRAVGASTRRAVPGSVRLDGYLDWTERIDRSTVASRCAYVSGTTVLELLAADLHERTGP